MFRWVAGSRDADRGLHGDDKKQSFWMNTI